jgi:hypothetical protein
MARLLEIADLRYARVDAAAGENSSADGVTVDR